MLNKFSLKFKLVVIFFLIIVAGVLLLLQNRSFPAGQALSSLIATPAKQADSFVASMGLNGNGVFDPSHFKNITDTTLSSVYLPEIRALGIRNYRVSMGEMGTGTDSFPRYATTLSSLSNPTDGSQPISFDMGFSASDSTDSSSPSSSCFSVKVTIFLQGGNTGSCGGVTNTNVVSNVKISSFESLNEWDHCPSYKTECQVSSETWYDRRTNENPNWVSEVSDTASAAYNKLQSIAIAKSIPIVSYSPTYTQYYTNAPIEDWNGTGYTPEKDSSGNIIYKAIPSTVSQLGATSIKYSTYGNLHQYCGNNAQSNCIPSKSSYTSSFFSPLPLIETEFGWSTNNVSQTVQAKYLTRGFFTNYDNGIKKSYSFTIRDRLEQSSNTEKYFGILNDDGTPKLAYTWLKNTISLLTDPGSNFATSSLTYSLTGSSLTNVRQDLFEKRDGTYWLVLYNDIPTSTDLTASVPATLTFGQNMDVTNYDPSISTTATSVNTNIQTLNLSIPDKIIILKITPTTVTTNATTTLSLSNVPSSATINSPFSLTVTARDSSGSVVPSYNGTIHFTSSDSSAVLPSNYAFTSADNGIHTFTGLTLTTTGAQTVTITDTSTTSLTTTTPAIQVTSLTNNPATTFKFSSLPTSATAGTVLNTTVTAKDASGNTSSSYTGTVHFTSSDAKAILPADYKYTSTDQGIHGFILTLQTAGNQTITVTDTIQTTLTATSSPIAVIITSTVLHVSSLSLTKTVSPSGTWQATATVTVKDGNNIVIPNATVTFSIAGSGTGFTSTQTSSCLTSSNGTCSVTMTAKKSSGITTYGFTVVVVSKPGYTFDNSQNTTTVYINK